MVAGGINLQDMDVNDPCVKRMMKIREDHARQQNKDYSHVFRTKSRFDLIRLSCIVVAIELAYSAETAFVSPILLQIGIDHKHMTMIWGLSPLLGFFMAPLLGSISDRCRLSIGRRRPIIIGLSLGILLGLFLVPYGRTIGALLGDSAANSTIDLDPSNNLSMTGVSSERIRHEISGNTFAFLFIILGTILLDFSSDTCQTPARSYLLDVCVPGDHARAMSTFTIMAGLGGTIGYTLGGVDWNSTEIGTLFGDNIQTVFIIVTVVFLICFTITTTSFREIPLNLIENDEFLRPLTAASIKKEQSKRDNIVYFIKEATALELKLADMKVLNGKKARQAQQNLHNSLKNISFGIKTLDDEPEEKITLGAYLKSIVLMPKSMAILCLTNLFCQMAHLSYCLNFTDFVGQAVFGGHPNGSSEDDILYTQGVRFGCWGLSIYTLSCSVYSSSIEKLMSWTSTKIVYIGGILSFTVGMLILAIWPTRTGVLVFSTTAGIIYATLFTIPFILVAKYHSQGCFKVRRGESVPLKQSRGLGTDIAIISSMVFVGQFIVSLCIGPLIDLVGSTCVVLYMASGMGVLAAISALNVLYLD